VGGSKQEDLKKKKKKKGLAAGRKAPRLHRDVKKERDPFINEGSKGREAGHTHD